MRETNSARAWPVIKDGARAALIMVLLGYVLLSGEQHRALSATAAVVTANGVNVPLEGASDSGVTVTAIVLVGDTTIAISDQSRLRVNMEIKIDNEWMKITSLSDGAPDRRGVLRAHHATTVAGHNPGAKVLAHLARVDVNVSALVKREAGTLSALMGTGVTQLSGAALMEAVPAGVAGPSPVSISITDRSKLAVGSAISVDAEPMFAGALEDSGGDGFVGLVEMAFGSDKVRLH